MFMSSPSNESEIFVLRDSVAILTKGSRDSLDLPKKRVYTSKFGNGAELRKMIKISGYFLK